jgi:hypothetical protein
MAIPRVALGFKPHTGWAAVVAVTGKPGDLQILLRRRIELLPDDGSIPKHIYHAAEEMGMPAATKLVARAAAACEKVALRAVRRIVSELNEQPVQVTCAGLSTSSAKLPDDLASVLRAHTLVHSAEGTFFSRMLSRACATLNLEVVATRERELWDDAAAAWGLRPDDFRKSIDEMRAVIGPPWSADQKVASGAALRALKGELSLLRRP